MSDDPTPTTGAKTVTVTGATGVRSNFQTLGAVGLCVLSFVWHVAHVDSAMAAHAAALTALQSDVRVMRDLMMRNQWLIPGGSSIAGDERPAPPPPASSNQRLHPRSPNGD